MSILVCDTQSAYAQTVSKALVQVPDTQVTRASGLTEACKQVRAGGVHLLVVGPGVDLDDALVSVREIRDEGSRIGVVLAPSEVTRELLHAALRAGVDDVVPSGAPSVETTSVLEEALRRARRRLGASDEPGATPQKGHVVTVLSMKGGVGKTVVASNVAVALAGLDKSVALVDLDLQFGDVGIMLGLEPVQTIVGAVQSGDRLDAEMLRGFMVEHSSGVHALLAPTLPEDAEIVTASRIDRIIGLLVTMFDYVIIDTPPSLDEAVLTALDRSDRVVVVTMMDVASVKNSRVSLQKLRQLGYNGTLVDIMLNRADSKVFLKVEEVEHAIGMPIKYRLPSDLQVPRSVNKGVPVVLDAPRSQPARVLQETAKAIVAEREGAQGDVA
ncbi:P-loop NTPase [Anaerosoma tenue]|uniref:P-loop NTPase n=1 Tax=Anaerosoma tenue TaxID=2933588 RepID=UPI0022609CEC|nr:P-loop NTPase [Anaerosoma tenue]MCK8114731.1 AAA family ATPase [Anaerosoma tenue]